MKVFYNKKDLSSIKDKYIFLDNDFLGFLFEDEEILIQVSELFSDSYFMIDPLTKIEFLRDIFIPAQKELRERFISNDKFFCIAENHPSIFTKIQENAIWLSQIYKHQNIKASPSMVDLFLAGRIMGSNGRYILITGNRKDFPRCIFKILAILNIEQEGDNSVRSFSVLEFEEELFEEHKKELIKVSQRTK